MPKSRPKLRIDEKPPVAFGVVTAPSTSADSPAPPVFEGVQPPTNVQLTTALYESTVSPSAAIGVTWTPPGGYDILTYYVQYSTSSTFATDFATVVAEQPSITLAPLKPGTLYYVRVATRYRSQVSEWTATSSITTAIDTTAPAAVTAQAAAFIGTGDLVLTSTRPSSANYKDTEIKIYASNGGALLATVYDATGSYIWTTTQNLAATAGVGDPSLFIEWRARSWGNVFSTIVSASATKAAPAAPTVSVDFTGADAVYTIAPPSDSAYLLVIVDTGIGVRRLAVVNRFVYTFDQNRIDHSGTPDPSLAYAFAAVDGLNQSGATASGTATNAAPGAPTITLLAGFSQLLCTVTSAKASDFSAYEYKWTRDGSTVVRTLESASSEQSYEASGVGDEGAHSWTCTVRQKDVFNQFSTATVSSAAILDNLTITYLRAGAFYTDSDSNTYATLVVLKDDVKTGGVSYAA